MSVFETIAIEKEDYEKLDADDKLSGKYTVKNPVYKLTEFKESHRQALFMILTEYFQKFKNNNYVLTSMPNKCKSKVVSLLASSDGIYSWFEEFYSPVSQDKYLKSTPIPVSDVYDKFSSSSYYMKLPKTEQRKLNKKNFIEKITTNVFLQKSLKMRDIYWNKQRLKKDSLVGWELKRDENENELDENENELDEDTDI